MPDDAPLLSVRELKALDPGSSRAFSAVLVVRKANAKTATNGNAYLSLELGDRSGSFSCNLFGDHPQFEAVRSAAEGAVIRLEARTDYYQNRFSPRIQRIALLTEAELAVPGVIDSLVEVAPESVETLWEGLRSAIESIRHDELRLTVRAVFEEIGDTFRWCPAAVTMHHAYRHGLLEHTVRMARAAQALLPLYPEVDADLALAGILLHDVGKTIEYEGAMATRRTRRGLLQGHVVLGYQLVRKGGLKARLDAERLERLEHVILSHQGEPEWGAAVYAATPEAVFVSMVDNLDARMGMVQRALRQTPPDEEFSERLPGLNSALLVRRPDSTGAGSPMSA